MYKLEVRSPDLIEEFISLAEQLAENQRRFIAADVVLQRVLSSDFTSSDEQRREQIVSAIDAEMEKRTPAGRQREILCERLVTVDCRRVAKRLRPLAALLSLPTPLAELLRLPTPRGTCCHVHQQRLRPATFSTTQSFSSRDVFRLKAGDSRMAIAKPTVSSACASLRGGDSQCLVAALLTLLVNEPPSPHAPAIAH